MGSIREENFPQFGEIPTMKKRLGFQFRHFKISNFGKLTFETAGESYLSAG